MLLSKGYRILDTVGIFVVFCKVWCFEYQCVLHNDSASA